jgi:hypothetical protein
MEIDPRIQLLQYGLRACQKHDQWKHFVRTATKNPNPKPSVPDTTQTNNESDTTNVVVDIELEDETIHFNDTATGDEVAVNLFSSMINKQSNKRSRSRRSVRVRKKTVR